MRCLLCNLLLLSIIETMNFFVNVIMEPHCGVYNAIISATAAAAAEAEVVVLGSSSSNGISQSASLQLLQLLQHVGDSDAWWRRRRGGGVAAATRSQKRVSLVEGSTTGLLSRRCAALKDHKNKTTGPILTN